MKRISGSLKTLGRLFFLVIFLTMTMVQIKPTSAQVGDLRRDEILRIAERYATHSWNATDKNYLHEKRLINAGLEWMVDTPDQVTEAGQNLSGWWTLGTNIGIPYQWGGFSALGDSDLHLKADFGGYYDEQLSNDFAAGDIETDPQYVVVDGVSIKINKAEYTKAAGIDCSGFISRAWLLSSKQGTGTRNPINGNSSGLFKLARPIKFEDLRPGDILNAAGHVILFKQFLTEEKATPNVTRFLAIEASGKDWKVGEKEYLLTYIGEETEKWGSKTYTTNKVTIQWSGNQYANYFPRTYITPIDVVLVIDRSGSMTGQSMTAAKNAAKLFVDLLRPGDKIGVVDFDDSVSVTYPLTEISETGGVKPAAQSAIDSLYARGMTSIGGGLQVGMDLLNGAPASDPVKIMVLLSDGGENTPPYAANVLPSVVSNDIVVHTIGLGNYANEILMQTIASTTGGVYRFSPSSDQLWQVYNSIANYVYGTSIARTVSGVVSQGGVSEQTVLVDSSVGSATFSLFWPGSDLDLVLIQPDGGIINPQTPATDPNVSFITGPTYEYYQIEAPQVGEWKMQIIGISTEPSGEHYSVSVSVASGISFSVLTDLTEYGPGTPMLVTASLEDSFLDVPDPQYVSGAIIEVVVQDPAQNEYAFELFDDGNHMDGMATDGIYGNVFTNTDLPGSYNLSVAASGNNLRDGQPFTREVTLSVVVNALVDQPPTLQIPSDTAGQYSDLLTLSVSATDPNHAGSSLVFTAKDLPGDLTLTDNHNGTATISGVANVSPGTYTAEITVTDPGGLFDTQLVNIVVTHEDARATYTGPLMVSTSSTSVSTATIPLRTTIQDITAVDPISDSSPGDITKAVVSFINRENNTELCSANLVLLDPNDSKTASAACDWTANIGTSMGQDFTIGVIVGGYYTRNSSEDDFVVVVSKPGTNFITGGGYLVNQSLSGKYAGDVDAKTNFGINLKFTKKLTNLQGRVNIIIRQNGRVYQIKSTALNSLVANTALGRAELLTKASIQDITNPLAPVNLEGGAKLQVVMKDNGEPGSTDTLAISVWAKDGKLLFSSNWTGTKTIPQVIGGGNLQIH